jgi:hypothetical protein
MLQKRPPQPQQGRLLSNNPKRLVQLGFMHSDEKESGMAIASPTSVH